MTTRGEYEWGILRILSDHTEVHRERMTQAEAQQWVDEWAEMGGKPGVFAVARRRLGPWTSVDDTIVLDIAEPEGLMSGLLEATYVKWPGIDPDAAHEIVETLVPVIRRHVAASLTLCAELREAAERHGRAGWDEAAMWVQKWEQVRERSAQARQALRNLRAGAGMRERIRLDGKLEGVELVDGYMWEANREP